MITNPPLADPLVATTLRLLDNNQWLIVCRVADEHRFVKSQPNSVVTAWAAEELTAQLRVVLAR